MNKTAQNAFFDELGKIAVKAADDRPWYKRPPPHALMAAAGAAGGYALGDLLHSSPAEKAMLTLTGGVFYNGLSALHHKVDESRRKTASEGLLRGGIELAGLGALAVPSIQKLRGKPMSERASHATELGGLGVLAAPYVHDFASAGLKGLKRFGQSAGGMKQLRLL